MSSKSNHNRQNQAAESRLRDDSPVEQRDIQIARDIPSIDDRDDELAGPDESKGDPEIAPEMGKDLTEWDEVPDEKGHKVADIIPDDETSVGKDLTENGLRGPRQTKPGEDRLPRND